MTAPTQADTWQRFVTSFYAVPNTLDPGRINVQSLVEQGRQAWLAQPPRPFLLPAELSGWPCWYVICPDRAQATWIRDLVRAAVGSWIDFTGSPIPPDSHVALDPPVNDLLSDRGVAYRFLTARDARSGQEITTAFARLGRVLASRPFRRVEMAVPLGRLVADFSSACATGAEGTAARLLESLENDHRVTRVNRLFLRVQFLAAFGRWDDLDDLPELRDLLNMEDRPVLVSDALARRVIDRLPAPTSPQAFLENADGALVPSVATIRSAAGAAYYAFWCLVNGEDPPHVAERLRIAGWFDAVAQRADVAALLAAASPSAEHPKPFALDAVRQAIDEGRADAAVDLMRAATPAEELLPLLLQAFVKSFSEPAFSLLRQWQEVLGPAVVEQHLRPFGAPATPAAAIDEQPAAAITRIFGGDRSAIDRERETEALRGVWLTGTMRPGELRAVVAAATEIIGRGQASAIDLIDALLDLEIEVVGAGQEPVGLQDLRQLVVDGWVIVDESGERRRAERVLDLIGRVLESGLAPADFEHLVEDLRASWGPFLTDAGFSFGLETIEVLAAYRPDGTTALDAFAASILSRLGAHNFKRLDRACVDTAVALAPEFALQIQLPEEATVAVAHDVPTPDLRGSVAIYSLMEAAARRAEDILTGRFPGLRITTVSDKVATDALRHAAQTSDLLVIADRAATHAATDALRRARGNRPLEYATGKGTATLVEAVMRGSQALTSARLGTVA
jgi:hypothetical protein